MIIKCDRNPQLLTACIIASLLVACGGCKRDASIRRELLAAAPVGSSLADVEALISRQGFTPWEKNLHVQANEPLEFWSGPASGYVSAILTEYWGPWKTQIVGYWILDDQQQLKDLVIERHADAP